MYNIFPISVRGNFSVKRGPKKHNPLFYRGLKVVVEADYLAFTGPSRTILSSSPNAKSGDKFKWLRHK